MRNMQMDQSSTTEGQGTSGVRQENPVLSLVPNQCTSVERAILETLEKMDLKINHLTSLVQSLVGNGHFLPQMQNDEDGIFPLASTEYLDRLEQSLLDRGFMQRMVRNGIVNLQLLMKCSVYVYMLLEKSEIKINYELRKNCAHQGCIYLIRNTVKTVTMKYYYHFK
ncbi:hypothetical protein DPX16_3541 [Anabarilius grahami]|uniref:Uncharacterized protein n=1 Tax=Anabarilius grahami TaxID=495550 RepID=A0A3N0YX90_ANAGA|nr:hypothetical protein DPX16_3541 [Anabarilius grahami]